MFTSILYILYVVILVLFGCIIFDIPIPSFKRDNKPKKYDIHYVRKLELENFGEYRTICECERCRPVPTLFLQPANTYPVVQPRRDPNLPMPPKGAGGGSARMIHCRKCGIKSQVNYMGYCQHCQVARPYQPRLRIVNGYRCLVPSEVPDNAYAEVTNKDFMGYYSNHRFWVMWRWIDETTGQEKFLRSLVATPVKSDSFDIMVEDQVEPIRTIDVEYNK